MCCTTVEQRWRVIGEEFNELVNALIRAASHANVCSGARIGDSVGCVSNDCKLDLVYNRENLYAKYSSRWNITENIWQPYQCWRSSTSKCRTASLGCAQGFAGGVSGVRSSLRNELSTASCHCHQCTRRAHSLLKDKITTSALLFYRS